MYKKYSREKVSVCNICLKEANLSWDHVPPKAGIKLTAVEQEPLLQYLSGDYIERTYKISQNGVKYRTLCSECNAKLGSYYDISLNNFAKEIGTIIKSRVILPEIIKIKTKPSHLVRAICGHLLAAKNEIDFSTFDTSMRDFIFDETKKAPDNFKVFYWLYPYSSTVVMRDTGILNINKRLKKLGMINLLKYFPIAYMVTDLEEYEDLRELTSYCNEDINQEISIPIDLFQLKEYNWPEIVTNDNILFSGQALHSGVYALPKREKN